MNLRPNRTAAFVFALVAVVLVVALPATAQDDDTTAALYRTPDPALTAIVDAPPTPGVDLGPGNEWLLLEQYPSLPPIDELAARELRLGGLRIDPAVSGPSRDWSMSGLGLVRVADGSEKQVTGLPAEPRLGNVEWSPDGSHVSFTHSTGERIEPWVLEVATGKARRMADVALSLTSRGADPVWLPNGSGVVAALVPADRGAEPEASKVPTGPVIRESLGRTAPARTFQDLLANSHDEALFEHYLTSQLAVLGVDGSVRKLGAPAMTWSFGPSPDGRFVMVESLRRPFSYLVPAFRFPRRVEVLNLAEGAVAHRLADLPLQEEVSIAFSSVPPGPRDFQWRNDAPATVAWVEALDGGDASAEAEERDRLFQLAAPFTGEPVALATLGLRFGGVTWGGDDLAVVVEWWWRSRQVRAWGIAPATPDREARLLMDYSFEDRYADPGNLVTVENEAGRRVLLRDGDAVFLIGDGASDEGDRPFLDRWDLASDEKTRLFHSSAPYYERPVEMLDVGELSVVTRRESVEEPPNFFVRDLDDDGEPRRLTDFAHPTPQLKGLTKELIRYQRADGVDLTATLYLPPGHDAERDGPLPTLVWAYPQEFKSADAAGQVTDSPYRFARVGWWSPLLWLTQGYAVLDDPTLPIIGEGEEEPNDTYVDQLVSSAAAAVDQLVSRGVAEPGQVAIGGHSYGAFMTANLLAHSDLFAAGIARSGAYNRTLTPFGFQAEERTVWEAPEVYFAMSPFMHADKIDEPILLIHGEADNNSGTFPMQSERFYEAVTGLGATARLVMLPHESHGYRARESVLHMLWESGRWLDAYVKEAPAERP
ncbi:MAG TPA: prolyl oligopeptidase family serine peptidase, partial [Thermoanaerobaculia bacterium]|nr:prolyl oligopeptidase family serine peptidase [Thermoanaerobaculia bacterium]